MPATLEMQRAMQERVIRRFGDNGTTTIRRRHTLKSQRKGTPAVSGVLLLVNGAHLAGVSSISLRADLLDGNFPKGCRFTIAGNATEYTASAAADASGGAITVAFAPVLAANAADGAAVTISVPYADYSLARHRGGSGVDELDSGEKQSGSVLHLAYRSDFTPAPGDYVVEGSNEQRIADVLTPDPGGGAVRFDVVLGGGA